MQTETLPGCCVPVSVSCVARHVVFPFIRDIAVVASGNEVVSGTTPAGFALALSGGQLLSVVGDAGSFSANQVVTLGRDHVPCTIDTALSNATVTFLTVPPITQLCAGDEACLLRGTGRGGRGVCMWWRL